MKIRSKYFLYFQSQYYGTACILCCVEFVQIWNVIIN